MGRESILRDNEVLTVNLSTGLMSVGDVDKYLAVVTPARGVIERGLGVSRVEGLGVSCRNASSDAGSSTMLSSSRNFLLSLASSTLPCLDGNSRDNINDEWELVLSPDVESELLNEEFLDSGEARMEGGGVGCDTGESTAKKSTFKDLVLITINSINVNFLDSRSTARTFGRPW